MLIIRTDASPTIGVGHVMRCLALAQAWQRRGGEVVFAGGFSHDVSSRLLAEGMGLDFIPSCHPAPEDLRALSELAADSARQKTTWVVTDGYAFDVGYFQGIKAAGEGIKLLVVDDFATLSSYPADLVLNQGVGAASFAYPKSYGARFLCGERYRMIRREFLEFGARTPPPPLVANRLMLSMGGADSNNVTASILTALAESACKSMEVDVVIGPSNRHAEDLLALVSTLSMPRINFLYHPNMPDVMRRADIALSAGGSTLCELAYMGVPTLVITVADNQVREVQNLSALGVVKSLGRWSNLDGKIVASACSDLATDFATRVSMTENGRHVVDGLGAERVVDHMLRAGN